MGMDEHFLNMFGEDDGAQNVNDYSSLLGSMIEHRVPPRVIVRVLFAVMWSDESPDCTDIRPQLSFYFAEHGYTGLTEKIPCAYLVNAGPIIGISLAVDKDKPAITEKEYEVLRDATAIVLRSGGIDAEVGEDGQIYMRREPGDAPTLVGIDIDVEVGKFREELDKTFGPDDNHNDPWSRWMR